MWRFLNGVLTFAVAAVFITVLLYALLFTPFGWFVLFLCLFVWIMSKIMQDRV